ncbi:putative periplasmic esterase [Ruminiclostridium hungatei]|uniref:Putative periplasmic esterase n=1 Tax=Ruminiclostridium hungatei TaxID=48256 RepID=A0A1V4SHJ1_RUMHU|nr:serine hydrolase [Ruminiclostridium hungatei]OPX43340.1 putative periplasmic esterase [Ruminiclostridium hungatei]
MIIDEAASQMPHMNTHKLHSLIRYIKESNIGINGIVILRNGAVAAEAYNYPHHREVRYDMQNCTMAVISALIGIAIDQGCIDSASEEISRFFPDFFNEKGATDREKSKITVENLLEMSSGFEWNDTVFSESNSLYQLWRADSQVGFILERPMSHEPGSRYSHNMGGIHLLSAILQKAVGMPVPSFALEKLFRPLGIEAPQWAEDSQNIAVGFYGLCLSLKDVAKIGQLYLQKGRWKGEQIISEKWIEASTRKRMDTPNGPWSFYGCGYVWNMNRFGGYCVKSLQGNSLFVLPKYSMVVAISGSLLPQQLQLHETLMETYLIPAARFHGDGDKAKLSSAQEQLVSLTKDMASPPEPEKPRPLPGTASRISGITYHMEPTIAEESFTFYFDEVQECKLLVKMYGKNYESSIGLDNVYRYSMRDCCKGFWENSGTFVMDKKMLSSNSNFRYIFRFEKDKLHVKIKSGSDGVEAGAATGTAEA